MRLHVTAMSFTLGFIWGAAIFIVAAANLIWPNYGQAFLELTSSIYPGYNPNSGIASVFIGTLYGAMDGAIGGAVFAWLYNFFVNRLQSGTA